MKFIGYYPGVDFTDPSQFGRSAHTKYFIENYESDTSAQPTFMLGRTGEYCESGVLEIGFGSTFISKLARDGWGLVLLLWIIASTRSRVVVYSRDSPYISKLFMEYIPTVCLVVEVNGLPDTEGNNTFSQKIYTWIRRQSRERADLLVAVSNGIGEELRTAHPTARVVVVENGVDIDRFRPENNTSTDEALTICYVGGLQEWQGVERMLEIVAALPLPVQFLVVGGTESRQQSIHEFADQIGIAGQVEIVGRVDHSAVPKYINRADICFGPFSKVRQASPLKIYEYMACGKRVVVLNDSGLEFLDSYPGVERLSHSLADEAVVEQILTNIKQGTDNDAGREFIKRHHSWDSVTAKIATHVRDACRG